MAPAHYSSAFWRTVNHVLFIAQRYKHKQLFTALPAQSTFHYGLGRVAESPEARAPVVCGFR